MVLAVLRLRRWWGGVGDAVRLEEGALEGCGEVDAVVEEGKEAQFQSREGRNCRLWTERCIFLFEETLNCFCGLFFGGFNIQFFRLFSRVKIIMIFCLRKAKFSFFFPVLWPKH